MRLPIIPTAIVAAAVAAMVWLGIWQLHRASWKKTLIARYETNARLPPVAWPSVPPADGRLLYRRASGFCVQPVGWRAVAGRNLQDQTGWSHIASCRTGGLEGPGMEVDVGWSTSPNPPQWRGGAVSGLIVPDRKHLIRLVAANAAPGLVASAPPAPADMPNNHLAYAVQWFAFAATALVIYLIALRRRTRREVAADKPTP